MWFKTVIFCSKVSSKCTKWRFRDPNFKSGAYPQINLGLCRHFCKLSPPTSSMPYGLVLLNWALWLPIFSPNGPPFNKFITNTERFRNFVTAKYYWCIYVLGLYIFTLYYVIRLILTLYRVIQFNTAIRVIKQIIIISRISVGKVLSRLISDAPLHCRDYELTDALSNCPLTTRART